MSLLQTALGALPPRSTVTRAMQESQRQLNDRVQEQAAREVMLARDIRRSSGCSWTVALAAARKTVECGDV